jgi:molybdopterin-guanine dinucleotide biosynthesis protein B
MILGVAGPSGSGKTTLIARILPLLREGGVRVSTIKHVHHDLELDKPGKDSFVHRKAGAEEVMVSLPSGWALFHPDHRGEQPEVDELVSNMAPVDLVLVEGFRALPMDKIEVYSAAPGGDLNQPRHSSVVAVAADTALPGAAVPVFDRDDAPAITAFILKRLRNRTAAR